MAFFTDSDSGSCPDTFGADIPNTPQEKLVNSIYSSVDEAARRELEQLRIKDSIITTCKLGCCHCRRQHIPTNVAESHTLAQYIKCVFSIDQIADLKMRFQQWLEWEDSIPGRYPSTHINFQKDISASDPYYPMLVKGACSAYPVRPVICRTHFVCSDARACRPSNDPESIEDNPMAISSILTKTNPFSIRIRERIENEGLDFYQSIMLLPHGLAIEMGWDFTASH